jgi:hypothetical protein
MWAEGRQFYKRFHCLATPVNDSFSDVACSSPIIPVNVAPTDVPVKQCIACTLAALGGGQGGETHGVGTHSAEAGTRADTAGTQQDPKKRGFSCGTCGGFFDTKQALGGHLKGGGGCLPPTKVTYPLLEAEEDMENAEARAGFDILNIRQAYLEETARLRFEHYVSDVGVQSAKEGFARVGGLTLEAIQSAVESVEDPAGIITAIVQANDDLMSTKQEQKARDKLYRCVSYRARFWAPNLSLSPGPVSGPAARF